MNLILFIGIIIIFRPYVWQSYYQIEEGVHSWQLAK